MGTLVRWIKDEVNSTGGTCLYLDAGDSEDSILLEVVEAYIRRHSPLGSVGVGRITLYKMTLLQKSRNTQIHIRKWDKLLKKDIKLPTNCHLLVTNDGKIASK